MAVFAPAREIEKTCRGKAGRSKPHPHYAGRALLSTATHYVAMCTSCGRNIKCLVRDPARPGHSGPWEVISDEELPVIGAEVLRGLR